MIAVLGSVVAHLGGRRGDRLFLSRGGGALETFADLGWDERTQTTPQRRMLMTADALFVLEPVRGPWLTPPLRVRRFDLATGRETGAVEGDGEPGEAGLYFRGEAQEDDRFVLRRFGLDPETGAPQRWEGAAPLLFTRRKYGCSGTPLHAGGAWWYPVRGVGLFRVEDGSARRLAGDPGPVQRIDAKVVCAGHVRGAPGVWIDGRWRGLEGPPLFAPVRAPFGPLVALRDGGLVVLRCGGGALPALDGAGGRLPAGTYGGLAALPDRLLAVAVGEEPRLVPVEF